MEHFLECSIDVNEDESVDIAEEAHYNDEDDQTHAEIIQGDQVLGKGAKTGKRRGASQVRARQCNVCGYITRKMSNMKTHVKNVHKDIKREEGDLGFTNFFIENPNNILRAAEIGEGNTKKRKRRSKKDLKIEEVVVDYLDVEEEQTRAINLVQKRQL